MGDDQTCSFCNEEVPSGLACDCADKVVSGLRSAPGSRHFLVTRTVDVGLTKIEVFTSPTKAAKAYDTSRKRLRPARGMTTSSTSLDLFTSDRLGTLLKAYGDWFDEPADYDLVRDIACIAASSREEN